MKNRIINYIRSGCPGLYLVSCEQARVEAELKTVAESLSRQLYYWSITDGLVDTASGKSRQAYDPLEALQAIEEGPRQTVYLLRDFHLHLLDPLPQVLCKFKDLLQQAKRQEKTLVIIGCRQVLPPELERELTVIEFSLPGAEQLGQVLDGILASAELASPPTEDRERILDAARGLTTIEAENAFALSLVEAGRRIEPLIVAREKASTVKKNGLLELIQAREDLHSIGGLDVLKTWLLKRKDAFSQRARDYGLPTPKGLLIIGIPGTGKSLTAKATAKVFGAPLLKLDAGRVFAGLVGQSEANLRSVIQTAEAIAPSVLWLDEIEKGLAGSKSSAATDGGTSARVFGSFISWLQEKPAPVFVVATANDVSQLPPELLRKGRFDELFFVDLPNEQEREAIWNIVIVKYERDPKDYDTQQLARATEGLTGSEIETAFVDALFLGFEQEREPADLDVAGVLNDLVPLSHTMAEQISGLRAWAKGRARLATSQPVESKLRRIAA